MEQIEKLDLQTMSIPEEKKAQLQQLFPEVFAEGKIDFEKLKQALGEDVDASDERFGLSWAGKNECFRIIQEPSIATLKPAKDESVNWDTTENLFIEGDNLEVLKQLQKSYYGEVKMIYIDPPYNTGNEFIYPDNYKENLDTYLAYTGQVNEEGKKFSTNTETTGRFHSKWLNMMYPRLYLARNLLKKEGVIFISIDDNEVHNLRELCNEVFGEENFVTNIIWEKKYSPQNDAKWFSDNHDHILVYAKNKELWRPNLLPRTEEQNKRYTNRDNDPRGDWKPGDLLRKDVQKTGLYTIVTPSGRKCDPPSGRSWRVPKYRFDEMVKDNRIWFGEDGSNIPAIKRFLSEVKDGVVPLTLWRYNEVGHNQDAAKEIKNLFEGKSFFDTPKPVSLIKRMLHLGSGDNDIILDFFAGSCSTAHAVLEINKEDKGRRKFIMVQLPEMLKEESEAVKSGYKNLAEISKDRIRKAIIRVENENKAQDEQDLGFKVFKLDKSNFKIWDGNIEEETIETQLQMGIDHVDPNSSAEDILYEILLKSGFGLDVPIAELQLAGKTVYSIAEDALLICLDKDLNKEAIKAIAKKEPARVVCLDEGFKGNDQLKTNAVQMMRSYNVEDFKTV